MLLVWGPGARHKGLRFSGRAEVAIGGDVKHNHGLQSKGTEYGIHLFFSEEHPELDRDTSPTVKLNKEHTLSGLLFKACTCLANKQK